MAEIVTPRPDGTNADWTCPQGWAHYSAAEHALWDRLYARQMAQLPGRAHPAFLDGLTRLNLGEGGIPDFERLSDRLEALTGWRVVAVPGLIPDDVFFDHLANRRFVAGHFIRRADQMDYLQEPDVFHDVFGHVPMLTHPVFADYMQAYGEGGRRAEALGMLTAFARLYWYTVEFGLIATDEGLRIYGAGIVSSHGESVFALDDPSPNRIAFDLIRVMRTDYKIDDYQRSYFVIDSFDDLLANTRDRDFAPVYAALAGQATLSTDAVVAGDTVRHHGTQAYAKARG